jgi:hypothetical protein
MLMDYTHNEYTLNELKNLKGKIVWDKTHFADESDQDEINDQLEDLESHLKIYPFTKLTVMTVNNKTHYVNGVRINKSDIPKEVDKDQLIEDFTQDVSYICNSPEFNFTGESYEFMFND